MYEVDERDCVVELKDLPQSSVGAPIPHMLADENRVVVAYYIEETRSSQDWTYVPSMSPQSFDELIAVVRFTGCASHMFGPPNDEAFRGHPLAGRGLHPYGVFRIEDSSWIRKLERMNSVHPYHRPETFWKRQHLIFSFHDSTFECVCDGFDVRRMRGSIAGIVTDMVKLLEWDRS